MAYKFKKRGKSPIKNNFLILLFFAAGSLLFAAIGAKAQSPTPTPSPTNESVTVGGFEVTTSFEVGLRGIDVNGNNNKYRSDFNYRPGIRLFDSSLLLQNKEKSGLIDSILVTSSGWNADPSGFTRISVERVGFYRFDSNIRQVSYFNNLNNHARNGHTADTRRNFGDFDLILYPNADKFRLRLGASYDNQDGTGTFTTRAFSDEFPVSSDINNNAFDLRAGIDSKLFGFNWSLSLGYRRFNDNVFYSTSSNPGYNTTNTALITTFQRSYPVKGFTQYGMLSVQRTFARKLDFTARIIYSYTKRDFGFLETITGRDSTAANQGGPLFIDLDRFEISGDSTRPQTRGDFGVTYAVTKDFRISESFLFDTFNINGGTTFAEAVFRRNAAGNPLSTTLTNTLYYRVTGFRRFVNTIEADYQYRDLFGFNIGWRYTHRQIELLGFTQTLPPATTPTRTLLGPDEEENQTNTLLAGFKLKPTKYWVIFADLEHGDADNAFTRLANYKFTNLRVRSRWSFNNFSFNISAITRDNENPSRSTAPQGNVTGDFIANIKSRIFSAYFDWSPTSRFSLSAGYTYTQMTSETDIVINTGTLVRGFSQFFMRDHYGFFDVSAQPFKRVSLFASYRRNEDRGQGDRVGILPILITSYPFKLFTGEGRVAVRMTKNIDLNLGYQYIEYTERFQPLSVGAPQDYHVNMPYISLRFYFGGERR